MMTAVGVDGCKTGWFFFRRDGEAITFGVARSFQYLCESTPEHARIFIDIPIGLIDQGPSGRSCDIEARKLLGRGKGSSVFPAPCRPVLEARTYNEAKDLSLRAIGKKLSQQAFAITPKIKEVDDILDALVALIVACTSDASLQTVPASPPYDSEGFPMEIVYTEQPNLGFL